MNDKLESIIRKLKQRLDFITIMIFFFIMIIIIFAYLKEIGGEGPVINEDVAKPMDTMLPAPEYDKVISIIKNYKKFEQDEKYSSLGKFNMFDPKNIKTKEQIEADILELFNDAKTAFEKAEYENTVTICNKILVMKRSHVGASDLLKQAQEKLKTIQEEKEKEAEKPKSAAPPAAMYRR